MNSEPATSRDAESEPIATGHATRRTLLAGALGGIGVWAAGLLTRANPVRGANGDVMHVGDTLTGTTGTTLDLTSGSGGALKGTNTGSGIGVWGVSDSGAGVRGESNSDAGVLGSSPAGIGLFGESATGYGLSVVGRAKFSTSGIAQLAAGSDHVTIAPGANVTRSSFVLLTPKANLDGRNLWFITNPSEDRFTIRISSPRSSVTRIAWLFLS